MHLGEIIKQYRKEKNINMRDFAKSAGISRAYVSVLERNQDPRNGKPVIPSIPTIKGVAEAMGISFDELFNKIDDNVIVSVKKQLHPIQTIYDRLDNERQEKVYNYAENQLIEQQGNVVHFPKDIINEHDFGTAYLYGAISAGTGEFVPDSEYLEEINVKGHVPIHDIALTVNGDSMEPLFKDKEIIYIEKTKDVKSGQIGAFIINGEAYVKKLYIEDNQARLVSLNKKYKDIIVTDDDAVEVVGRVVI